MTNGKKKVEIIGARTDTECSHATHNKLLHVLLDVAS